MKAKSIKKNPPKEGGPDDSLPQFICLGISKDGFGFAGVFAHPKAVAKHGGYTHWLPFPELE